MSKWLAEPIPDGDTLYHRVHRTALCYLPADAPENELHPNMFRADDIGDGKVDISADWSKYSTPQEAKDRARVPEENGIVEFTAGDVRDDGHKVEHSPDPSLCNRAHSSVYGTKARLRATLSRVAQWSICLQD